MEKIAHIPGYVKNENNNQPKKQTPESLAFVLLEIGTNNGNPQIQYVSDFIFYDSVHLFIDKCLRSSIPIIGSSEFYSILGKKKNESKYTHFIIGGLDKLAVHNAIKVSADKKYGIAIAPQLVSSTHSFPNDYTSNQFYKIKVAIFSDLQGLFNYVDSFNNNFLYPHTENLRGGFNASLTERI